MDGTLTIRGISKTVPLIFTFKGRFPDTKPGHPPRTAFHASASSKRGDFAMTRDNSIELGVPPTPGNDVDIQIDVEADAELPKKRAVNFDYEINVPEKRSPALIPSLCS
jgi:polyisoprenoid-binding protein YceI